MFSKKNLSAHLRHHLSYLLVLSLVSSGLCQGMWLPLNLKKNNEKEMRQMGFKLKADDVYHAEKASLKDGVAIFGGGCTSEVVSAEGLLLTNHHCGFGAIQNLSTLEKNYVEHGFWAKNKAEELPAGVSATFVMRMEDVSIQVLQFVRPDMAESERKTQIDKNIKAFLGTVKKETWQDASVKPFYEGNKYYLFITETYKDVRLVGTPPSSVGKFGSDTDNWVWPRHTGDFAVFRIYADKDNHPAEYSAANVPYRPRNFFPVSTRGVEEGDFTMVLGFPGRTQEYLPAVAVEDIAKVYDPARIAFRDRALKIMDAYMRQDPAIKIRYVAKYASIANAWKKWIGESQGLLKYGALDKKRAYEAEFSRRLMNNAQQNTKFSQILPSLNKAHQDIKPFSYGREAFLEAFIRNTEASGSYLDVEEKLDKIASGKSTVAAEREAMKQHFNGFFAEFVPEVDQAVFASLSELYATDPLIQTDFGPNYVRAEAQKHGGYAGLAQHIYSKSLLTDKKRMEGFLAEANESTFVATLSSDPMFVFCKELMGNYRTKIIPRYNELQGQINTLQRNYMAAQLELFPEKRIFPDANSTLRVTYGKVKSYYPRDAVQYLPITYLEGVMEKYVAQDYEFDVPQKLRDLYKNKDYGPYAAKNGKMPVAFIATNHTTGGNSGSPAVNAKGELIGINFDRVWEGTMSDIHYDPEICRNIMVDIRYVLFIIDKYAGAGHLVREMELKK